MVPNSQTLPSRTVMIWGPADTSLGTTTAGAAKPREPHRHRAEQRRDLMKPPVLDVTPPAAGRAVRPRNRMILGLRGNDRLLHPCQKLLRLRQRQPQIRDIAKVVGPADLQHLDTSCPAVGPRFDQLKPTHPRSPSRQRPDRSYRFRPYPPISGHSLNHIISHGPAHAGLHHSCLRSDKSVSRKIGGSSLPPQHEQSGRRTACSQACAATTAC